MMRVLTMQAVGQVCSLADMHPRRPDFIKHVQVRLPRQQHSYLRCVPLMGLVIVLVRHAKHEALRLALLLRYQQTGPREDR